jgi:hypothetical protein
MKKNRKGERKLGMKNTDTKKEIERKQGKDR